MYHRVRTKMKSLINSAIVILVHVSVTLSKTIDTTPDPLTVLDHSFDNNIIDFDEGYTAKFNKNYGAVPWHSSDFKKHRYTLVNDLDERNIEDNIKKKIEKQNLTEVVSNKFEVNTNAEDLTSTTDYSVIPLELISTTENVLISLLESTAEPDLTVIPLPTTQKSPTIVINQTVTLPTSTQDTDTTTNTDFSTTDSSVVETTEDTTTEIIHRSTTETVFNAENNSKDTKESMSLLNDTLLNKLNESDKIYKLQENGTLKKYKTEKAPNVMQEDSIKNTTKLYKIDDLELLNTNSSKQIDVNRSDPINYELFEEDVPIFTELDADEIPEVPDDYYDSKDVVPTSAPKTDALSVIFGLAGSVVESVAERVVPKSIYELFKRMQKQNEALEAERLRSREENGGIGQFGRGLLKTISTGLSKPLSQLMAGAGDAGSLDSDRGFVGSLASGVTSVANVATSVVDSFKDRVQAIYPGTVWCGDGRSATARSGDLGLFFFTDTCCRQHDACKLYIKAGETKYGLTNTGLFTRSHCSCDKKFRECLQRTNSLVSSQIGLTYFNVLGPQCFRRSHPIIRCVRKTRITGQKCEEYELDYTKPKMWQWFDNETF